VTRRNPTRAVRVGNIQIGDGAPIAVQSMAATRTQDIDATVHQVQLIQAAGADLVRIAVDSKADVQALSEVRDRTRELNANLSVDLQESYRLITDVAPFVDKVRYNPGHLHHHEKDKPVAEKVAFIAEQAEANDIALRVGVNCGSVDPLLKAKFGRDDVGAMVESALQHTRILDDLGFTRYVVSMKDSDWRKVVEGNRRFSIERPEVPLHLGVTEAGMPPNGIIKTRVAFEQLIAEGIGDTIRVSLTLPFDDKGREITVGRELLDDIANKRFRSVPTSLDHGLNIISCPSCSRVENEKFIELAQDVKAMSAYAKDYDVTIAVMGCRVNGPGETDDADIGMWCGPLGVNLKLGETIVGHFPYDSVLNEVKRVLDEVIATKAPQPAPARD
jgi:(E)-4-hydroxy-3-methylbut-2-enyl-diphosphate synthase